MALIVKREGHEEAFDERKVYGSCYAAVLNTRKSKEVAEQTCAQVCAALDERLREEKEITSTKIFHLTIEILKRYDPDASFMYETHRDLS